MPAPNGIGDAADRLKRIASLAETLGDASTAGDARSAAERIAEGRFYVACVGQFKRGKSALLNALIGEPILPTGVVPVTAIPTILRYCENRRARVRLEDGNWIETSPADIAQYVAEENNPENRKRVSAVEVFLPSALLAHGMCLVDTPGLGSVFEDNTAATHAFLPQIDAAIVVIGADPPIGGEELVLVETVSRQVHDLLFVLNKADRVSDADRDAAVTFAREVLEKRLHRRIPPVFQLSALEQLSSDAPQRDWSSFADSLDQLAGQSSHELVREAGVRSLARFSAQLLRVIREERNALSRPFAESEKRIAEIRETSVQAEQSLNDLGYLLSGEQNRLSKTFAEQRNAFLKEASKAAKDDLSGMLRLLPRSSGPRYRRAAMHAAQEAARKRVMPWLEEERENSEKAYLRIAQRFRSLANDFLARTRKIGELDALPGEVPNADELRTNSDFQFYEFTHVAMPASPPRYVADVLLGIGRSHSVIDADAYEFLDRLLETNSERVRNDLEQRVADSRQRLESHIRKMLQQLIVVAEQALARARHAHAEGAEAVQSSLEKLAAIELELGSFPAEGSPNLAKR